MYCALLLFAAAKVVAYSDLWTILCWLALALVLLAKAMLEERGLRARFPGYSGYAKRVRRFIPGLFQLLRKPEAGAMNRACAPRWRAIGGVWRIGTNGARMVLPASVPGANSSTAFPAGKNAFNLIIRARHEADNFFRNRLNILPGVKQRKGFSARPRYK